MRPSFRLGLAFIFCAAAPVAAQEKERVVCSEADPKNKCPGADCTCTTDTLEVTFDGATNSVKNVKAADVGTKQPVVIMTETKNAKIQGWSYAVAHDEALLTLNSVTTEGTDMKLKFSGGFDATSMEKIESCKVPTDPKCAQTVPGGGWISAVVLSLTEARELPLGRNSIAKAEYTITKDPGGSGTLIMISDRLKKMGSPPVAINFTIGGKSRVPTKVTDGFLVGEGTPTKETNCTDGKDDDGDTKIDCADTDCAADPKCTPTKEICNNSKDDDGDSKIDCADSDCTADPLCTPTECPDYAFVFGPAVTKGTVDLKDAPSYVISMRNKDASLGFQLGVKSSKSGTATGWEFSGTLGADANRLIELIISDNKANSKTPSTPNKATSTVGVTSKVERGAAISKFSTNDFFAVDLNPGVGGPGFTVGYVADVDGGAGGGNQIAATPTDAKCLTNEILKVTLGTPPEGKFRRGDADGNSKLNVVDAILIIQVETGNLQEKFDCDDALDANDDGNTTVSDAITVLTYVFQRGPEPPDPFPACGTDPTADTLTCNQATCQ